MISQNSLFNNYVQNSTSQAYDDGVNNVWYAPLVFIGNFWSNLGLNLTYEIAGSAGAVDFYPLSTPI